MKNLFIVLAVIFLLTENLIGNHNFDSSSFENADFECKEEKIGNNLLEDDFEAGIGNWTSTGSDALHVTSVNSPNGNSSVLLRDDDDELESSIFSPLIDLTGVISISIDFNFQAIGMDGAKFFYLEISPDGGNNYVLVEQWVYGSDFNNGTVYNEVVSIANSYGSSSIRLRFTCNGSSNSDQIYLDDIKVQTQFEACSIDEPDCSGDLAGLPSTTAYGIPTFHCIGMYWSPPNGNANRDVLVRFRECGTSAWQEGLAMLYNPVNAIGENGPNGGADYRGSLVNLQPETTYIIELTLEGTTTKTTFATETWSENFPIGQTIDLSNQQITNQLTFGPNDSGTPSGYTLIDGTGATINAGDTYGIRLDDIEYVIVRGFTIINATKDAIFLEDAHHIVIEDNDISRWGSLDSEGRFGENLQSAIRSAPQTDNVSNIIIQRNKIYNPNYDSNNWTELNSKFFNTLPHVSSHYHPNGPQAITLFRNEIGNHVIRYNEIWSSDPDIYFNDVMGANQNASYGGFPGPDSDIYGNYIANCWDDAIEADGANRNTRIWDNYITNSYVAVSNTPTTIGPLYVWRNVLGESSRSPGSGHGYALKCGFANNVSWMTGHGYFLHNTILQPVGNGYGGVGTNSGNRRINNMIAMNNILHVNSGNTNAISNNPAPPNTTSLYDHNLYSKPIPIGVGANSISGTPSYQYSNQFDLSTLTGRFQPSSNSLGVDAGAVIPNFTGTYTGVSPDMGAFESGSPNKIYGTQSIAPQNIMNNANHSLLGNNTVIDISLMLCLEGALNTGGQMNNQLLQRNLLPPGQPYDNGPWNYPGKEGEGWTATDYPPSSVDWILISLRETPSASTTVVRLAAVVLQDGSITASTCLPENPLSSYYIVVEHRNHLPAMTPQPVAVVNEAMSYDFRMTDSYAVGVGLGQKQVGGNWCLYSCNADQSNPSGYEVTGGDNILWQAENGNFDIYESVDFNLDGDVNAMDKVLWTLNNGVFSAVPK